MALRHPPDLPGASYTARRGRPDRVGTPGCMERGSSLMIRARAAPWTVKPPGRSWWARFQPPVKAWLRSPHGIHGLRADFIDAGWPSANDRQFARLRSRKQDRRE